MGWGPHRLQHRLVEPFRHDPSGPLVDVDVSGEAVVPELFHVAPNYGAAQRPAHNHDLFEPQLLQKLPEVPRELSKIVAVIGFPGFPTAPHVHSHHSESLRQLRDVLLPELAVKGLRMNQEDSHGAPWTLVYVVDRDFVRRHYVRHRGVLRLRVVNRRGCVPVWGDGPGWPRSPGHPTGGRTSGPVGSVGMTRLPR